VKQMRGQYKVKSEELKPLFERAKKMSQTLEMFRIEHVYREQNREADALVNQALDETSRPGVAASSAAKLPPKDSSMRFFARYKDGALHPEDALNLPDGTDVEVILRLRK
jgi:hypothetical protein